MNPLTARWLAERPHAPALHFRDRSWSWAELDAESARVARALGALGLRAGERVALLASNAPEIAFAVHAAARAGFALVLLNTRLAPAELADQISRARCTLLLLGEGLASPSAAVKSVALAALSDPGGASPDVAMEPSRPLALLYTSGTTGKPKAAMLSLGALVTHAAASAAHLGRTPNDVHLCNLPLFHVGGLSMLFRAAECGGAVVLHERFEAERVLRDLAALPVTHLSLVATTLARLLDALGNTPWRAPHLRVLLLGGGPLPEPLRARAEALGLPLLATYGLTEACSQVTTVPPGEREAAAGTSGQALPGVRVRIVDAERREVPAGTAGEIEVQGPTLMLGYDGNADATAAALDAGWLRTRDLGTLDPRGYLTVHARRSDLILSGGENVYPAEIEAVLLGLPGVRDAAVVGRADATWGQVPVAAVVLDGDQTPERIRHALEERLARYKQPREIVALGEIPRTASGKVERQKLREKLGLGPL